MAKILWIFISMIILFTGSNDGSDPGKTPPDMVFVKGGTFLMGSTDGGQSTEKPVHDVTLDKFYIGKFEVTQEEWQAVMGNNPSLFKGNNLPVEQVTWYAAVEYCNKRSKKEGLTPCYSGSGDETTCNFDAHGYRLPTEAEWEYACRGGENSRNYTFSGSSNPDEVAWHEINSGLKPHPVGQKKPNEIGIYDMSGNIWEWCWDWYDDNYYKNSPPTNPRGPASGKLRCYRGGGFAGWIEWLRNTARYKLPASYKRFDMGLRVVKKAIGKCPPGMVPVEGGKFSMGNIEGGNSQIPQHKVTVNSFYMGKFEVTQGDWLPVMGYNASSFPGLTCPVMTINWHQAIEYCNKRSKMEGLTPCYSSSGNDITCNFDANGYRLPTEAEWEYACRGGQQSQNYTYSGSNNIDEVGWYRNNIGFQTEVVGQKKPNELGIYDMNGNVWEWCWDWYAFNYYKNSPSTNPKGPMTGIRRVVRGGSIYSPAQFLKNSTRNKNHPYLALFDYGLRVVRTAK